MCVIHNFAIFGNKYSEFLDKRRCSKESSDLNKLHRCVIGRSRPFSRISCHAMGNLHDGEYPINSMNPLGRTHDM